MNVTNDLDELTREFIAAELEWQRVRESSVPYHVWIAAGERVDRAAQKLRALSPEAHARAEAEGRRLAGEGRRDG